MSAWIQVAGYADDLQVAYDHHKLGGPIASQRFWERYQRTIDSIRAYDIKLNAVLRSKSGPQVQADTRQRGHVLTLDKMRW